MDKDYGESRKAARRHERYDSSVHHAGGYADGKEDREWWHAENLLGSDAATPTPSSGGGSRGGGVSIGDLLAQGAFFLVAGGALTGFGWIMSAMRSPHAGTVMFVGMLLAVFGAASLVGVPLGIVIMAVRALFGIALFCGAYAVFGFFVPEAPGAALAARVAVAIAYGGVRVAEWLYDLFF